MPACTPSFKFLSPWIWALRRRLLFSFSSSSSFSFSSSSLFSCASRTSLSTQQQQRRRQGTPFYPIIYTRPSQPNSQHYNLRCVYVSVCVCVMWIREGEETRRRQRARVLGRARADLLVSTIALTVVVDANSSECEREEI